MIFQSPDHTGPAITCQRCLFLGHVISQQSMKNTWEKVNSKSFQHKTKHTQCTHERLQSKSNQNLSQNPVRFPSPFRPSVFKGKRLQTSMSVFSEYPESTTHRAAAYSKERKKEKSYRYLHLGNIMFSNMVGNNIKESSLKECQKILIISSNRFSRNSQKYQLHTHRLTLSLIQKTNSDIVDLQRKIFLSPVISC